MLARCRTVRTLSVFNRSVALSQPRVVASATESKGYALFFTNHRWYCQSSEVPNHLISGIGDDQSQAIREWQMNRREHDAERGIVRR